MSLQRQISPIPEVILVEPLVFKDDRGFFLESYHQAKWVS
jgi:dTDP-4-dehydrorhamnose 3,5-epimerase-like enzyme